MPRTIIRGGKRVLPTGVQSGDILIENGKIADMAGFIDNKPDDQLINAEGLLVLPGIVDAHTHIHLDTGIYKTADNWEIGTGAAAAGGVTTVVDFATQYPGQSFDEAVDQRLLEAEKAIIDYAFHTMVTELPVGKEDTLQTLIDRGLPSIKVYTTYRPNYYMDDATLLRILRKSKEIGGFVIVHAENDDIVTEATQQLVDQKNTGWEFHAQGRPAEAEWEAVHRMLYLAELAGNSPLYIVHCSTANSVEMVEQARQRGQGAFCETCPQYLLLNDDVYSGDKPEHFILQPPLRPKENNQRLWDLVKQGKVNVLSTDSCDYTIQQKREFKEFTKTPGGLPGVETLLSLVYTYGVEAGLISLSDMVRLLCENPARLFGIDEQKGFLTIGTDADLVLYDPEPEVIIDYRDLHYLSGYSPYQGMKVQGQVQATFVRGDIVYQNGEVIGKPGHGRFTSGKPFDPAAVKDILNP